MPADATLILSGIEAVLKALRPDAFVYITKRPVAGGKPPSGGWNPGWRFPAFVLSAADPEEIDAGGDFETVTVGYAVTVEYVKQSAAKTSADGDPRYDEDPEFRDARQAVRRALYKPALGGVANPTNVRARNRPVYEFSGAGGSPVTVSGAVYTFEVGEPRPE